MENKKTSSIVKYGLIFLIVFFGLGFIIKISEEGIDSLIYEFGILSMLFGPFLIFLIAIILLRNASQKKEAGNEDKKKIYKRQTLVTFILSVLSTFSFINWFKQPNSNEAVWISGLFFLIPIIILWTVCLSYFNKYRKERNINQTN
jgi:Na+/proline symporter